MAEIKLGDSTVEPVEKKVTVLDDSDDRGRDIDTHVLNEKAQRYRDQFNAEMAERKLAEMPPEDKEDVAEVALPPETEFELQPQGCAWFRSICQPHVRV